MIFVFFIYGLAFFILGVAILLYPKKGSKFRLADDVWLIGAFGILHGINEWLDMFALIQETTSLNIIRLVMAPVSFFFLLWFGTKTIADTKKKYSALKALPVILFAAWAIITAASVQWLLMGDIWSRYLLGAPGIFLTSYALILQLPKLEKIKMPTLVRNVKLTGGAFFFYGIFSGLIVPEAGFFPASTFNHAVFLDKVGVPVQAFRAFCAIAVAYGTTRVLGIFVWETDNRVRNLLEETQKAHDELELRVEERTVELQSEVAERKQAAAELQRSEEKYSTLVEKGNDGIIIVQEGLLTFVNSRVIEMTGLSEDDAVGKPFIDFVAPEFREGVTDRYKRRMAGEEVERRYEIEIMSKDGRNIPVEINASVIDYEGKPADMAIIRDITERKEAEWEITRNYHIQNVINRILQVSLEPIPLTEQLERVLDLMLSIPWLVFEKKGAIFLVEDDPDVLVMKAQRGLHEALASTCDKVPFGRCICGRAAASKEIVFVDRVDERHENTYEGIVPHGHYCVPIRSGERVLGVLNLYVREGHKWNVFESEFLNAAADAIAGIVERKQAEMNLEDSERVLLESQKIAQIGSYVLDIPSGTWTSSEVLDGIFDIDEGFKRIVEGWTSIIHPDWQKEMVDYFTHDVVEKRGSFDKEYKIVRKNDGVERWVWGLGELELNKNGEPIKMIGTIHDITERKKAEEELQKAHNGLELKVAERTKELKVLVNHLQDEVIERKKAEEALRGLAADFSGISGEELFEKITEILAKSLDMDYAFVGITSNNGDKVQVVGGHGKGKKMDPFEYDLADTPCKNVIGQTICSYPSGVQEMFPKDHLLKEMGIEGYAGTPLFDSKNNPLGLLVIMKEDVILNKEMAESMLQVFADRVSAEIERKESESRIKNSLSEKEVLLQEIHHRVKNNLQVISSLLYLQSKSTKDKEAIALLNDSRNRVKTMALIHEKLYQSEDLGSINITDYLKALVSNLSDTYKIRSRGIKIEEDFDEITLDIDKAIPCGLIVNELITNSLQHAFPGGRGGKIKLSVHQEDENKIKLTLSDDGIGIPKGLDPLSTQSLGLKLIRGFVEKLKGEIEIDGSAGTEFRITFLN